MQRYLSSPNAQAILACLGRGVVSGLLAYCAMLVKHVADRDTIIGTIGFVTLVPLAGYLHLLLPSFPLPQARGWPRIGHEAPVPDQPPPSERA